MELREFNRIVRRMRQKRNWRAWGLLIFGVIGAAFFAYKAYDDWAHAALFGFLALYIHQVANGLSLQVWELRAKFAAMYCVTEFVEPHGIAPGIWNLDSGD